MERDTKLFKDVECGNSDSSFLCVYSWARPCVSLGYSQKQEEYLDADKCELLGLDVVKRPTGGGIVFHNLQEVTYSLVTSKDNPIFPKGLIKTYMEISKAIVCALKLLGVDAEIQTSNNKQQNNQENKEKGKPQLCFSYPAEYEIVVGGKKIVGSAQKRGKRAFLQQGSIFVRQPNPKWYQVLKKPYQELNAISVEEALQRQVSFDEMSKAIVEGFKDTLGIKFHEK